jgi:hypothetical protein
MYGHTSAFTSHVRVAVSAGLSVLAFGYRFFAEEGCGAS